MGAIEVRQATVEDVDVLVPLFEGYRRFYRLASDAERSRNFLLDRMTQEQSVVFLAVEDQVPVGFTQLYPSFSSAALAPIFVLNDLFVAEEARGREAGRALLQAAAEHGRGAGAIRLVLSTEVTNATAQALYERNGWKRDIVFCVYKIEL
jgi:ribosomal protein S18 acetylase RimI-like enzyme